MTVVTVKKSLKSDPSLKTCDCSLLIVLHSYLNIYVRTREIALVFLSNQLERERERGLLIDWLPLFLLPHLQLLSYSHSLKKRTDHGGKTKGQEGHTDKERERERFL